MSAVSLRNDSFASSQLGSPNPESSVTMDSTGGAHDDAIQKTQLLTEALKPNKTIGRTESPSGLRWTKSLSRRRSKKTLKRAISNPHLVSTTQNLDNTIDLVNLPQSNTLPQKGVTNTSPPLPPLPLPSTKPVSPYQASMQKPLSYDRVAVPQAMTEPRGSPLPTSPQLEAQPRISTHSQDSTSKASRMSERTSHSSTNTTRYGAKLGDTSTIRSPNGSFTLENGLHSTPSKPPSQLSKADPAASVPTMAYMADNASDLSFATAANAPPSPMPSAKYSASSPTISHQTPSPRGAHTPVWTTSPNTPTKPPASPPVTNGPPRLLLNELNIDNGSFWNLGEANNVAEKPTPAPSDSHHSTSDPRMTPDSYVGVATTGDSVQTAGPAPVYSHATVATSNSSFSGVPDDLVQAMGSQPYMGADDSMSALLGHLPSHYSTDHASLASTSMRESRIGEVIAFPQENDSHVTHTSPLQLVSPMGEPVSKVEVDLARSGSDATVRGGNHSRKSHDTSVYDIYFSKSRDDDTRSPRKPVADNFKEIHMGSRPITTLYSDVPPQRDMNSMPRVGSTINPIWQVVAGLNDRSSVYSEAEPLAKRMSDLSMLSQREAAPVNNNTSITSLATEQDNRTLFTEARAAKTEFVPIEPLALSSNSARMLEKLHDDERSLSSTEDLEQPELVSGHPSTATTALPSSPPEPTAPTLPKRSSSPIIELNDQGLPVQIVYYNDDELPEIMDKIASGNNSARIEFRRRSAFPEIDAALRKEEEDKQKTESTEDSQFNRVEQSILSLLRPTFSSFGLGSTGTGS
ncbi:hypothetical protein Malapachy_2828 [Malassezia pachydermatis]|uniref:Uncharacterized protein n=1 Tax=Malassezia pachydermatis TaxID=77020 RepID=A0A0N0RRV2_9BASI|nr:hypothetical protein Malapachy_2828 [Malassezia pachydermatis]KOS12495.1 hypothetical protein Malapachy_2828 [Malassezia pachydermatis]